MLALSPKQRDKFGKWMRPDSLCEHPEMIYAVSSFSIRQAGHRYVYCHSEVPAAKWSLYAIALSFYMLIMLHLSVASAYCRPLADCPSSVIVFAAVSGHSAAVQCRPRVSQMFSPSGASLWHFKPSTHWQQSWIQHGQRCWKSTVAEIITDTVDFVASRLCGRYGRLCGRYGRLCGRYGRLCCRCGRLCCQSSVYRTKATRRQRSWPCWIQLSRVASVYRALVVMILTE